MDSHIKEKVLEANQWLVNSGLVSLTWGNVSALAEDKKRIFIKPSGINLGCAIPSDVSEVGLSEKHLSGKKPSVDTPTHLCLYHNFNSIKCIVHTHSKYATIWAQAHKSIPCFGTTHADYFDGTIPCVKMPSPEKVRESYERSFLLGRDC